MSSSPVAGDGGRPAPIEFVRSAIEVAERAVAFDNQGNYAVAIYMYNEAHHLLERAAQEEESRGGSKAAEWQAKASEYMARILVLNKGKP